MLICRVVRTAVDSPVSMAATGHRIGGLLSLWTHAASRPRTIEYDLTRPRMLKRIRTRESWIHRTSIHH